MERRRGLGSILEGAFRGALSEFEKVNGVALALFALGSTHLFESVLPTALTATNLVSPLIGGITTLGLGASLTLAGMATAQQNIMETGKVERTIRSTIQLLAPVAIALGAIGTLPSWVIPASIITGFGSTMLGYRPGLRKRTA